LLAILIRFETLERAWEEVERVWGGRDSREDMERCREGMGGVETLERVCEGVERVWEG